MIFIKNEDIVNFSEDIVVYDANIKGELIKGVGRRLADKFERLEPNYAKFCCDYRYDYRELKHDVYAYFEKKKIIVSMFCKKPDYTNDIKVLKKHLEKIKKWAYNNNKSVAIPYFLASETDEEWQNVYRIIKNIFLHKEKNEDKYVNVSIYMKVTDKIDDDIAILKDIMEQKDMLSDEQAKAIKSVLIKINEEMVENARLKKINNVQKIKLEQMVEVEVFIKQNEKILNQINNLENSNKSEIVKEMEKIKLTSKHELLQSIIKKRGFNPGKEISNFTLQLR